ncbi:MAG TPA: hypothetical protein VGR57_11860 [Ktedonobacterales bacterium]|nr:hypothetical protein [Ktedonobacterales bacterium]
MNSVQRQMFDLHGLCWEAIHFSDALPFFAPLVALVGQDEIRHLQREARIARRLTGGLKTFAEGEDQDTVTVLMLRLLADADRTGRLVRAYRIVLVEGLDFVGVDVRATGHEWLTPDEDFSAPPG